MANIHTVSSWATAYADMQLANQQLEPAAQQLLRKRVEYDFKVTGFNAATVAMISFLALSLISNSVFSLVLLVVSYGIRRSFMNAIDLTVTPVRDEGEGEALSVPLMMRMFNLWSEAQKRIAVTGYLEIEDANWQTTGFQVFDLVLWKNWIPTALYQT